MKDCIILELGLDEYLFKSCAYSWSIFKLTLGKIIYILKYISKCFFLVEFLLAFKEINTYFFNFAVDVNLRCLKYYLTFLWVSIRKILSDAKIIALLKNKRITELFALQKILI